MQLERNRALHADTIKKLENAREVAATANAAALAAEKAKDAVEAETERLLGMLDPKRPRTEAAAEDPDAATLVPDDMDLATHRREHTRVMHRRAVELIDAPAEAPAPRAPRTGKTARVVIVAWLQVQHCDVMSMLARFLAFLNINHLIFLAGRCPAPRQVVLRGRCPLGTPAGAGRPRAQTPPDPWM